jgi:hypothetical protein
MVSYVCVRCGVQYAATMVIWEGTTLPLAPGLPLIHCLTQDAIPYSGVITPGGHLV